MAIAIKDADLFLVNRESVSYKLTGEQFKNEFGTIYLDDVVPPIVTSVTIAEATSGGNRFEDQSFYVSAVVNADVSPDPNYELKSRVSASIKKSTISDTITGTTDGAGVGTLNGSQEWSSGLTGGSVVNPSFPVTNVFDGSTSSYCYPDSSNNYVEIDFTGLGSASTVEINYQASTITSAVLEVNGVSQLVTKGKNTIKVDVAGTGLNKIKFTEPNSSDYVGVSLVKVDGLILIDGPWDTSQEWSESLVAVSGDFDRSEPPSKLFNSNTSTAWYPSWTVDSTYRFEADGFTPGDTVTMDYEVNNDDRGGGSGGYPLWIELNGVKDDWTGNKIYYTVKTITTTVGADGKIVMQSFSPGAQATADGAKAGWIYAAPLFIKVNGVLLVDESYGDIPTEDLTFASSKDLAEMVGNDVYMTDGTMEGPIQGNYLAGTTEAGHYDRSTMDNMFDGVPYFNPTQYAMGDYTKWWMPTSGGITFNPPLTGVTTFDLLSFDFDHSAVPGYVSRCIIKNNSTSTSVDITPQINRYVHPYDGMEFLRITGLDSLNGRIDEIEIINGSHSGADNIGYGGIKINGDLLVDSSVGVSPRTYQATDYFPLSSKIVSVDNTKPDTYYVEPVNFNNSRVQNEERRARFQDRSEWYANYGDAYTSGRGDLPVTQYGRGLLTWNWVGLTPGTKVYFMVDAQTSSGGESWFTRLDTVSGNISEDTTFYKTDTSYHSEIGLPAVGPAGYKMNVYYFTPTRTNGAITFETNDWIYFSGMDIPLAIGPFYDTLTFEDDGDLKYFDPGDVVQQEFLSTSYPSNYTWSDYLSFHNQNGSINTDKRQGPVKNAFDGSESSYSDFANMEIGSYQKFTNPHTFSGTYTIECATGGGNQVMIDRGDGSAQQGMTPDGTSGKVTWTTTYTGNFNEMILGGGTGVASSLYYIKIDGVLLTDPVLQSHTVMSVDPDNNQMVVSGGEWSPGVIADENWTSTSGADIQNAYKMFDGNPSNQGYVNTGYNFSPIFTAATPINVSNSIYFKTSWGFANGAFVVTVQGTPGATFTIDSASAEQTFAYTGTVTGMTATVENGSVGFYMIKMDGKTMRDGPWNQSDKWSSYVSGPQSIDYPASYAFDGKISGSYVTGGTATVGNSLVWDVTSLNITPTSEVKIYTYGSIISAQLLVNGAAQSLSGNAEVTTVAFNGSTQLQTIEWQYVNSGDYVYVEAIEVDGTLYVDKSVGGDSQVDSQTPKSGTGHEESSSGSTAALSSSNDQWIGPNNRSIDFMMTDGKQFATPGKVDQFLKLEIDTPGQYKVTEMLDSDPGFIPVSTSTPTIKFPSTLDGQAVDNILQPGADIYATMKATNPGGSDEKETSTLTPAMAGGFLQAGDEGVFNVAKNALQNYSDNHTPLNRTFFDRNTMTPISENLVYSRYGFYGADKFNVFDFVDQAPELDATDYARYEDTYRPVHNVVSLLDQITARIAELQTSTVYVVTVAGGKYSIDGVEQDTLDLNVGETYVFDQSDSTNVGHALLIYADAGKVTQITAGVTTNGTAGSDGAYTQFIPDTTGTFYYQCVAHSNMGGQLNIT